jgi:flagellar basal-body rod protein FlgF
MGTGIVELGGAIISQATQRVELAAQNLANVTTAGYKSRYRFQRLIGDDLGPQTGDAGLLSSELSVDFTVGKLQNTGNPLDLAISGPGFFTVRQGDQTFYTRAGQFVRDTEGRMVTPDGAVLQAQNGDIELSSGSVSISADGTVQQNGQPVGQIAIATFDDPHVLKPAGAGLFSAPAGMARDSTGGQVRQGMLESSNVTSASEMISMMSALHSAEAGQRLVQVYDDLMGQVITNFGQN